MKGKAIPAPSFNGPVWNKVSASAKDHIGKLMHPDAKQRLTASQALNHPWLREATALRAALQEPVKKKIEHALVTGKETIIALGGEWSPAPAALTKSKGGTSSIANMSHRRAQLQRKLDGARATFG